MGAFLSVRGLCVLARCTIKKQNTDGLQVFRPTSWCGRDLNFDEWAFKDAQHLGLSVGGSIQPCKACVKAIIKELQKELD